MAETEVPKKPRGRPFKLESERRRNNMTFRINDALLASLTAAAKQNQRSISEEIEKRIEVSFSEGDLKAFISRELRAAQASAFERFLAERYLSEQPPINQSAPPH